MTHLIIAGKESDPVFAEAEAFGYFLQKNLPDFKVTIDMKQDDGEYQAFLRDAFAKHKWSDRLAADRSVKELDQLPQAIYRPSGQLIGSTSDFLAWVRHAFGIDNSALIAAASAASQ